MISNLVDSPVQLLLLVALPAVLLLVLPVGVVTALATTAAADGEPPARARVRRRERVGTVVAVVAALALSPLVIGLLLGLTAFVTPRGLDVSAPLLPLGLLVALALTRTLAARWIVGPGSVRPRAALVDTGGPAGAEGSAAPWPAVDVLTWWRRAAVAVAALLLLGGAVTGLLVAGSPAGALLGAPPAPLPVVVLVVAAAVVLALRATTRLRDTVGAHPAVSASLRLRLRVRLLRDALACGLLAGGLTLMVTAGTVTGSVVPTLMAVGAAVLLVAVVVAFAPLPRLALREDVAVGPPQRVPDLHG